MTTEPEADVNLEGESAFMQLLDLSFEEMSPERVVAFFETGAEHHQPWGLDRGGVFAAAIETAATTGAYYAVKDKGQLAVGVNNVTDFLRPHQQSRLRVVAEPLQQGELQQLWQGVVERDEDGKTVARPGSPPKRRGGDLRALLSLRSVAAQRSSRVSSPR